MRKRLIATAAWIGLAGGVLGACAAGSSAPSGATSPSTSGEAAPTTIGAARSEFTDREHDFQMVGSDCEKACKALASLERAANHLCMLSEPDECADARARVDRARRAVTAQCGGC